MAKYFLGSVGKAEAFRKGANGELTLAFVSKTLTDSGLNISTTKDDIRAGEGAPIQFSFFHDSNVEITLTDVLWKPEYLESQIGARFSAAGDAGNEDYITEQVTFTAGVGYLQNGEAHEIPVPCSGMNKRLVWGAPQGSDEWVSIGVEKDTENEYKKLTLDGANGVYCVRYLGASAKSRVAEITATIVPEELFLVITAPIFAGDACAASKGKAAGHITFEVPRYQLNGSQEFAMSMSSNQTMSLSGTAMASEAYDCDANGGKLLRIIEVIDNRDWKEEVVSIILDEESAEVGDHPSVYAELKDGHLRKLELTDLEYSIDAGEHFTDMGADFVFEANDYVLRLKGTNKTATADLAA